MKPETPLILIGPMCAGKSTVGALLAERLGIPQYGVDEHRWGYYQEIGYDEAEASRIADSDAGMKGLFEYWKPFEAYAVQRILETQSHGVIDFGAGHSVYEDAGLFNRVQSALAPFPYVILILPSPDLEKCVHLLNMRLAELLQREVGHVIPEVLELNEFFIKHPSNQQLAKQIIYTEGKSPEKTCQEILTTLKF
jgi:hypothetical protein